MGDTLAVVNLSASSGTVSSTGPGIWSYTPAANYNGPGSFTFKANDGTVDSNVGTVSLSLAAVNDAPVVATALANQSSPEDTAVSFTLPAGTFTDVDDATLTLSAKLAGGAALPSWLSFNAVTGAFSGTPPLDFNGNLFSAGEQVEIAVLRNMASALTASLKQLDGEIEKYASALASPTKPTTGPNHQARQPAGAHHPGEVQPHCHALLALPQGLLRPHPPAARNRQGDHRNRPKTARTDDGGHNFDISM